MYQTQMRHFNSFITLNSAISNSGITNYANTDPNTLIIVAWLAISVIHSKSSIIEPI